MPKSKKGRLSGATRKELNQRASSDAVDGKIPGLVFARVTRMLGMNHIRVAIACSTGYKEIMARIPNKLGKKGSTPLTTNNVVSVFAGIDFNPNDKLSGTEHFDVHSILDDKEAYQLFKEKRIPGWMLKSPEEVQSGVTKSSENEEDGFEFDYHKEAMIQESDEDEEASNGPLPAKKKSDKDASGGAEVPVRKENIINQMQHDDDAFDIDNI